MDIATVAKQLHGCTYPLRLGKETEAQLKDAGIVIVHGNSDDIMSFSGAIYDEVSCYDGGTALLDAEGLLSESTEDMSEEELRHHLDRKTRAMAIHALWSDHAGPAWTYNTEIPCQTFEVIDDGEIYCIGLVFSLGALSPSVSDTAVAKEVEDMLAELPPEAVEVRHYFETLARAGFSRHVVPSSATQSSLGAGYKPAPAEDTITLPRYMIEAVVDRWAAAEPDEMSVMMGACVPALRDALRRHEAFDAASPSSHQSAPVVLPRRLVESLLDHLTATESGGMPGMSNTSLRELRQALTHASRGETKAGAPLSIEGLSLPQDLLPETQDLVVGFANALGEKLAAAQRKYGYGISWSDPRWMPECHQAMAEHLRKGDPRDVAAYCAFLWYHGESTSRVVHELYQQSSEIAASRRLQAAAAELMSACRAADCLNKGPGAASLMVEE